MEQARDASPASKRSGPFDLAKAASEMAGITQTVLDALRGEIGADGSAPPAGGARRGVRGDGAAAFVEFGRQGKGLQATRRGLPPVASRRRGEGGVRAITSAVPFPAMASLVQAEAARRSLTYLPRRHCARVPSPWKSGAMPPSSWISARNTLLRGERALLA